LKISHMTGKLSGVVAINTSPLDNDFCKKQRKKKGTVCASCFSVKMLEACRQKCRPAWKANGALLSRPLGRDYLQYWAGGLRPASGLVRFNGHGELINRDHAKNLFSMARMRLDLGFALWTKRADLVRGLVCPANLSLVFSEEETNKLHTGPPAGFDKVFCVISDPSVAESNCDRKNCADCRICYDKSGPRVIIEVLK